VAASQGVLDGIDIEETEQLGAVPGAPDGCAVDDGAEVRERSRDRRAGDSVLLGSLLRLETSREVEVDSVAAVTRPWGDHVDPGSRVRSEIPQGRGRPMAQHRVEPIGEDGREPAAVPRQHPVTDRVHTAME
jgi:hypothetical protein